MKFHQPEVTQFVMVAMKCKPSPPLPNPTAPTEQPCTRAGERLDWRKMIPSENPWTDPTSSYQQLPAAPRALCWESILPVL